MCEYMSIPVSSLQYFEYNLSADTSVCTTRQDTGKYSFKFEAKVLCWKMVDCQLSRRSSRWSEVWAEVLKRLGVDYLLFDLSTSQLRRLRYFIGQFQFGETPAQTQNMLHWISYEPLGRPQGPSGGAGGRGMSGCLGYAAFPRCHRFPDEQQEMEMLVIQLVQLSHKEDNMGPHSQSKGWIWKTESFQGDLKWWKSTWTSTYIHIINYKSFKLTRASRAKGEVIKNGGLLFVF